MGGLNIRRKEKNNCYEGYFPEEGTISTLQRVLPTKLIP